MYILENIKDFFAPKKQNKNPFQVEQTFIGTLGKVFGITVSEEFSANSFSSASKRNKLMNESMNELVEFIKNEKTKQPLLNRTINNIIKDTLKGKYLFISEAQDLKKCEEVRMKFEEILYNSHYQPRNFLREMMSNLVSYSNCFLLPIFDKDGKLQNILTFQNKGWKVNERIGSKVTKWEFNTNNCNFFTNGSQYKKVFSYKEVWHGSFNKESDEVFGMPLWTSVIPILNKYNHLLDDSIDSYSDQSIKKNIYMVGVNPKNQNKQYVSPEDYNKVLTELQRNPDDDLITNVPIDVKTIEKKYTSPDKILDTLEFQIIAGLHTSKSQLGSGGTGRQDADTQQTNTLNIIQDFQENLEDFLNHSLIRMICIDLYGDYSYKNIVKFKFEKSFNDIERNENHTAFMFQAGLIDLEEARKRSNIAGDINVNKTMNALYQKGNETISSVSGTVSSKASPQNQHSGKNGTGTTKPSVKN